MTQNEIESLFVEELTWEHHGLRVVQVDGEEYAVAKDEDEAQKAAIEAARDSLWAFNTAFLDRYLDLTGRQVQAIAKMQADLCEGAQEIVELLLGSKLEEALSDAVAEDGRGHFLSPYDGEEKDGAEVSPALEGCFLYRIN